METYRVTTVLKEKGTLILEHLPFQEGDCVEVVVAHQNLLPKSRLSPANWPTLQGGRFLGIAIRREDIYDDAR